jgi:predicted neuraminidase
MKLLEQVRVCLLELCRSGVGLRFPSGRRVQIQVLKALLLAELSCFAQPSALLKKEFLFEDGAAPTNHTSTLVETRDGLLAAWIGGPESRHPSSGVFTARYDAREWSKPALVFDGTQKDGSVRYACWNPVLFQPSRGPLLMFYKVGPSPEGWWGMLTTSTNQGRAWSAPTRLPAGFIGPVRNKPVELANDSLLCGASTEEGGWAVHMEHALDRVTRWEKTPNLRAVDGLQAIQPAIFPHGDGTFQILCRTKQGFLAESRSKDKGRTWSELRAIELPNPNGAVDGLRLSDGRFLLVYNDSATVRGTLSVAISKEGRDWTKVLSLESADGEFSYPAVIQARNGLVHITYSWNRQRIRHAIVDPAKLPPASR